MPSSPVIVENWNIEYKEADLFLFPSKTDTQGLVLLEAMACSTPVVAVPGPGQKALIQEGKNGVLINTEEEMKQAIYDLADNIEVLSNMQKEAWVTAQGFLPEQFREKLLAVYWQLIESKV